MEELGRANSLFRRRMRLVGPLLALTLFVRGSPLPQASQTADAAAPAPAPTQATTEVVYTGINNKERIAALAAIGGALFLGGWVTKMSNNRKKAKAGLPAEAPVPVTEHESMSESGHTPEEEAEAEAEHAETSASESAPQSIHPHESHSGPSPASNGHQASAPIQAVSLVKQLSKPPIQQTQVEAPAHASAQKAINRPGPRSGITASLHPKKGWSVTMHGSGKVTVLPDGKGFKFEPPKVLA